MPAQLPAVDSITADTNKTFKAVDIDPSFPGGIEKFYRYLVKNQKYPAEARKTDLKGKVFITFVIERDGMLTDIKIVKSLSAETDAEAIRLIKDSPKWKPGIQNGRPVRVQYTLPIPFPIDNE